MKTLTSADAQRLLELLEAEESIYREVLDLSSRQIQVIDRGEPAELLTLLAQKQKRIEAIDRLSAEIVPLRERCEAEREKIPSEMRQALEEALRRLREILAEIVALENEGEKRLQRAKDAAGNEIETLQRGKAMHKAYGVGGKVPPSARFKDTNG